MHQAQWIMEVMSKTSCLLLSGPDTLTNREPSGWSTGQKRSGVVEKRQSENGASSVDAEKTSSSSVVPVQPSSPYHHANHFHERPVH